MSVLVVTGSSRGIGAEVCRMAAMEGWAVCVNYSNSQEEANAVVEEINAAGGNSIAVKADVSVNADVARMFEIVDKQLGPVTALVNNAGINGLVSRLEDIDAEITARVFGVNVMGPFLCSKYAIKRMAKRYGGVGGVIVNVSSAAAKHGGAGSYIDYASSKGALDAFTVGLAKEQAKEGVRVNTLRPGATMTELSVQWANSNPEWLDWVMEQVPLGRPAEVSEIANGVMWLLSDKSSYVTGATLDVSGGWVSP
ncbi:MAG: SDR family oxidoreductase [Gammaproteobacteria bacterium]|nr:SDR family oxidoreductase [Gammaproteobacteria bacterium]